MSARALLTLPALIAAGINPTAARTFMAPLADVCAAYAIDTPRRLAAFIGQCSHESAGFTRLEENLFYTTPERLLQVFRTRLRGLDDARTYLRNPKALANRVYAGVNGNGDEASGDGWRYRGRGLIGNTGRDNYGRVQQQTRLPVVASPDLLTQPLAATQAAAAYWVDNGLNAQADAWGIDAITRAINGRAMAGAQDRRERCERALEALASTAATAAMPA